MKFSSINKKYNLLWILGLILALVLGVYLSITFNTPEKNEQLLKDKGYTSIEIGSYNFWCPKGILLRRHFKAIDSKGQEVEGSLCGGSFFMSDKIDTKPINKEK